jgi:hypothetical protein
VGGYDGTSGGHYQRLHTPYTFDLTYTLYGFDESTARLLSLEVLVLNFFSRNRSITIPRDANDASLGTISYEMAIEMDTVIRNTTAPNNDNLRTFQMSFVVRGVHIEAIAGVPGEALAETGGVVDDVELTVVQK